MKTMKIKNLIYAFFICISVSPFLQAQTEDDKTVTLTVTGTGSTSDEAKEKALRNAIEQAFGAFISSRTEILNDELISDQITSIASGNIKSYEILNEAQIPTGGYAATLKATVSVNKLTRFVEAKGVNVEINGDLFAMNVKQQMLNELAETKLLKEMVEVLQKPMQTAFDYTIKSGAPKSLDSENKNWEISLEIRATCNSNMDFCAGYCMKILEALKLSSSDISDYKRLNKKVFRVDFTYKGKYKIFYFRNQSSIDALIALTNNWDYYTKLFTVNSGRDELDVSCFKFGEYGRSSNFGGLSDRNYNGDLIIDDNIKGGITLWIKFCKSGDIAEWFNWKDHRTLNQIEQMTGYSVKPKGSQFKYGGIVVYEENGHGLVITLDQIGRGFVTFEEAKAACEDLVLNGYDDWYLPSKNEALLLYNKLFKLGFTPMGHIWISGDEHTAPGALGVKEVRDGYGRGIGLNEVDWGWFPDKAIVYAVRSF